MGSGKRFLTLEGILCPDLGDDPALFTYCVNLVKSLTLEPSSILNKKG